jgi:ABC-2 type transport system ATP-binding protein
MTSLIELRNLTKDYGSFRALDAVNLVVDTGITGLLGPNGAGKSTLIKVLLGLVRVTSGHGHVLGHDVTTESAAIRAKVGYMPEDDCYMHGSTGIESVQVAARLSCLPRTEALRRGHEIMDFCGIDQERYRKVETYSTGMRQKLRFAMAIVHDPELLILDEPTSGLDPEEREAMLNRISILSEKFGKSVILCTHILPDVRVVCDAVTILAAGKIRLSASLSKLLKSPAPSINIEFSGNGEKLADALQSCALSTEVQHAGILQVVGEATEVSEQFWRCVDECGIAVRNMTPSQSSLEEVFLKSVRENRDADS